MTTQTEVKRTSQPAPVPFQVRKPFWPAVAAVLIILSLVGTAILVMPSSGAELTDHQALEAISARYQGMMDAYAVRGAGLANHQALEVISARYQGMADAYAFSGAGLTNHQALEVISARYQGMADAYAAGGK